MITIVYFISLGFLDFLLTRECGFFIFVIFRVFFWMLAYSFQFYVRNRTHTKFRKLKLFYL